MVDMGMRSWKYAKFAWYYPFIYWRAFWKFLMIQIVHDSPYCAQCGACGEEGCCPSDMCHGGPFCLYRKGYDKWDSQ